MRVAGVIVAVAVAAPAAGAALSGAGERVSRARIIECMRSSGWSTVAESTRWTIVLGAADGHAQVQLRFFVSVPAARASMPGFVPLGVGWDRNVTFVFAGQATLGDELTLENCIYYG